MVVGVYLALDDIVGISHLPKAVLVVWLASLPCTFVIVRDRSRPTRYAVYALILVLLFGVSQVNWNSRKPVSRAFYAIDPGMTVEQVDRIMAASLSSETTAADPVRGWPPKPVLP